VRSVQNLDRIARLQGLGRKGTLHTGLRPFFWLKNYQTNYAPLIGCRWQSDGGLLCKGQWRNSPDP
jgi:hypothetical protein